MKLVLLIILLASFTTANADVKCKELSESEFRQLESNPDSLLLKTTAQLCKVQFNEIRALIDSKGRECQALPQTREGNHALELCKVELLELHELAKTTIVRAMLLLKDLIVREGN